MTFIQHRHDMMHRGLVPSDQLASGTPADGDVPTWNEDDEEVQWGAGGGGGSSFLLLVNLAASGAYTADLATASLYDLTLSGNLTLTPMHSDPPFGKAIELRVLVRQALSGGPYTLAFGGAITWATPGGAVPAMPTTSGQFISLRFLSVDDGATWIGYVEEDPAMALDDLSDVTAPTPSVGDVIKWNGSGWVNGVASTVAALDDLTDVVITAVALGDGIVYDGASFINRPSGRHTHVVGESLIFDGTSTVYYLANEAEQDSVAAYNGSGARVAITHDTSDLTKITFAAAPAAGTGFLDYIPTTA